MSAEREERGDLIVTLRDHKIKGWDTIELETSEGTVEFQVTHQRPGSIRIHVRAPRTVPINIIRAYTPGEHI